MTLNFDTKLNLSRWSSTHPLHCKIKLDNEKKFEMRRDNQNAESTVYQLYNRIPTNTRTITLKLCREFETRDETAKQFSSDSTMQSSFTEDYGNQKVTYISFRAKSNQDLELGSYEDEIKAVIWMAFKISKQTGNAGRLCIQGDKSHEKIYSQFLKKISNSPITETFYMYLPQENVASFEKEMNLNIKKLKLTNDNNLDAGMWWILVGVTMIFLSKVFS